CLLEAGESHWIVPSDSRHFALRDFAPRRFLVCLQKRIVDLVLCSLCLGELVRLHYRFAILAPVKPRVQPDRSQARICMDWSGMLSRMYAGRCVDELCGLRF